MRSTLREKNKKIGVLHFKENIDSQRFELLDFFITHGRRRTVYFLSQKQDMSPLLLN